MTVRIEGTEALVRALEVLSVEIQRGLIVGCSLHYEANSSARISILYRVGGKSELPDLPGVSTVDDEAITVPIRGGRVSTWDEEETEK